MKILIIHTNYQQRGGEDIVYENEAGLLKERGIKVRLVLFNNFKFAGIKFILSPFNPFSFIRVWREISHFKPDVVHVHNWFFGASPSVFWAARLKRVPVVYTVHNFRLLCPSAVLYYNGKLYKDSVSKIFPIKAIRLALFRKSTLATFWVVFGTRVNYFLGTWKGIDRYICLTEKAQELMCNSYLRVETRKVIVKPNFFEEKNGLVAGPSLLKRTGQFLFIGRLTEEKGVHVLLDAFSKNGYQLIIIGDGPLKSAVSEAANISANIEYRGFQRTQEIISALDECSALIMPSACYEPFGLVIIEAFSRGTPVIASDVGAPADLVTHGFNGLHFEAGDPLSLTAQINYWTELSLQQKKEYYRASRAIFEKNYTKQTNFITLTQVYQSVILERK